MSKRQDRQGVRTPADIEQKYDIGGVFKATQASLNANATGLSKANQEFAKFVIETRDGLEQHENDINGLNRSVATNKNEIDELTAKIYPVGSIYLSVNNTNPSTIFGGTWVQIKDRFLLAAGSIYSAGATGGEATHRLTENEIPRHSHDAPNDYRFGLINPSSTEAIARRQVATSSNSGIYAMTADYNASDSTGDNDFSESVNTALIGGGVAHNNMPPYLAVYMWKRTA